jgi:hypothetical protein
MPTMDVIIGQVFALVLGGLLIGVAFSDLFVNKKSYILLTLKAIGKYLNLNRLANKAIEKRNR